MSAPAIPGAPPPPTTPWRVSIAKEHEYARVIDDFRPQLDGALGADNQPLNTPGYVVPMYWPDDRAISEVNYWFNIEKSNTLREIGWCKFRAFYNPVTGRTNLTPNWRWIREQTSELRRAEAARRAHNRRHEPPHRHARGRSARPQRYHGQLRGGRGSQTPSTRAASRAPTRSSNGSRSQRHSAFPPPGR